MDIRGGNLSGVALIDKYRVPNAPTIGTATATGSSTVTVSFTAPSFDGNTPITSYTAVSSPGGITGTLTQSGSGTITVTGLSAGTEYTFTVYATNSVGNSNDSSPSNSITTDIIAGQIAFISTGSTTWTVPDGVTSISVVAVGGGQSGASTTSSTNGGPGGAGAWLAYRNNITVTPGTTIDLNIGGGGNNNSNAYAKANGGNSVVSFSGTTICLAQGGGLLTDPGISGQVTYKGGNGGGGGVYSSQEVCGGGGGAAGYSGVGGNGSSGISSATNPAAGSGGARGSSYYGYNIGTSGAGGVGILGRGTDGNVTYKGGSGGGNGVVITSGSYGGLGGNYGGGGGGSRNGGFRGGTGGQGAIRIIWPGNLRYFPDTRTGDE